MENPSGTTEQVEVNPLDVFYGGEVSEPATDNAETAKVEEPEKQEAEPESTDEVDSEVSADDDGEVTAETTDDSGVDDEVFIIETKEGSQEVNLSELRNGYLRQSDYTKKTQAIAEEKKAIDAAKQQVAQTVQVLQDIESGLGELIMGDFAQVDWNTLRDTDPSQYLAMKEAKEGREKAIEQLKAKRDQLIAQQAQEEAGKLHEALGWSDAAKRDADVKAISEGVKAAGIPDEVFSQVTNSALMSLIYDGIKHRKLQEKKPEIMRKVQSAPKVASKPSKQPAPEKPKTGLELIYG